MRRLALAALALALASCAKPPMTAGEFKGAAASSAATQGSARVAQVHFKAPGALEALGRAGVDLFENVDLSKGLVDAALSAKDEALLKRMGLSYSFKEVRLSRGLPTGFRRVEAIMTELQELAAAHPEALQLEAIGRSLETVAGQAERPILAARFGARSGASKPAILITSGQHARELAPVELTMRLVRTLAEGYGKDPALTELVDTRDIWIVPVVNPDGRVRVEAGNAMWRKNARDNGDGTYGVDTNRNADDHFEQGNARTSAQDYRGKAPFSEPESQALRSLFERVKFAISLDVHAYAGMILWPPGYTTGLSADDAAYRRIGEQLGKRIGYRTGTIAQTIYKTYGDLSTWQYEKHGTLAFAAELNDSGFSVPYAEVERDWKDWKDNFLYLIKQTDAPRRDHFDATPTFAFNLR